VSSHNTRKGNLGERVDKTSVMCYILAETNEHELKTDTHESEGLFHHLFCGSCCRCCRYDHCSIGYRGRAKSCFPYCPWSRVCAFCCNGCFGKRSQRREITQTQVWSNKRRSVMRGALLFTTTLCELRGTQYHFANASRVHSTTLPFRRPSSERRGKQKRARGKARLFFC
jgi:hypothetical protein